MPVRVPFRLLRRLDLAPAAGLLLPSPDPAALLAACARLVDPVVFPVAGGFLIVADAIPVGVPNATRLRRLSENLYLPIDADLIPALMPAEAVELTARRGLVFVPNRDALAFDATRPLRPAAFLAVPTPRREHWEPFPAGDPPADRLTAITRIIPDITPDDLLQPGSHGIGTESPQAPQVGPGRRALGRASLGLGKGLSALGRLFGSKGLAGLGGKFAGFAVALAPRLTEELLGKQEAALQRLLQRFREGQTDDALRHAIPVGEQPGRGGQLYESDKLPPRSLSWSLSSLFGGGGAASIWAGGNPDTWRDLVAEYRKAARDAADRGDFRRAAVIYAKLLNDFRSAAEVLSRGGLHREAGIVFRDKVKQLDRAAREFEQAGEHDEALRLYRAAWMHIEAGDLLRRLGDENEAVEEYHRAAQRVIDMRRDYVEAGDILLRKTGRADLAVPYFELGWDRRRESLANAQNALPCAERLIEIHALAEDRGPFWNVFAEAEEWLREPARFHDAGRFFNKALECGDLAALKSERPELHDRCRLGLAGQLRQFARAESTPGTAVADLFGASRRWSPAVLSDAEFAVRAAVKRPRAEPRPVRGMTFLRLHSETVTAAVVAAETGDLFVGFRDGLVFRYDSWTGEIRDVHHEPARPVVGLATDLTGESLAILCEVAGAVSDGTVTMVLAYVERSGPGYRARSHVQVWDQQGQVTGLLPLIDRSEASTAVGVNAAEGVTWYDLPGLIHRAKTGTSRTLPPTTHLRLRVTTALGESTVTFEGGTVAWGRRSAFLGWMPDPAPGSTLHTPQVAWLVASPHAIELAGLFDNATIYWSEVNRELAGELRTRTVAYVAPGGFRAVTVWRPGRVIGVTATNRIVWLKARAQRFEEWAMATDVPVPSRAVGCFPSRRTNEVLVALDDGGLVRVPVPT